MKRRQFLSIGAGLPALWLAPGAARAAYVASGLPFAPPVLAPLTQNPPPGAGVSTAWARWGSESDNRLANVPLTRRLQGASGST